MSWWLFFMPVLAAFAGWLFTAIALQLLFHPLYPKKILGVNLQGIIPKRQQELAVKTGELSARLLSMKEIEEKITHPDNVKKIMPQAEAHIDNFLRVKLVKSMPVVGMFVGDKTINNLKSLFVNELELLFPEIMKNYIDRLQEEFNIEKTVTAKIAAFPPWELERVFLQVMKKELAMVKTAGAVMGLIIGLMQLIIILLTVR